MVPKVILEGAFYSPNASEGRWAWNIARLLDKMASMKKIESYLYIPEEAQQQYFFSEDRAWRYFDHSRYVSGVSEIEFDTMLLIQPGGDATTQYLNDNVKADKRIHGQFELYWYGDQISRRTNLPENYEFCYAMEPHSKEPSQQNWPTTHHPRYHLPYAPDYQPGSDNFDKSGILLTIKSPIHSDYTEEEIRARIDHFEVALEYANKGIRVTVGYANRLFINPHPTFETEFRNLITSMERYPLIKFEGNVAPLAMRSLIEQHSIVYTGKLGNVILYASFMDALNYGSVPIIWTDWPEQFFRGPIFPGYLGKDKLKEKTDKLLSDPGAFIDELDLLRKNITLHTEQSGMAILERLIGL